MAYGTWSTDQTDRDGTLTWPGTAAVVAFYEHLPLMPGFERHIARWFTRRRCMQFAGALSYFGGEAAYRRLLDALSA